MCVPFVSSLQLVHLHHGHVDWALVLMPKTTACQLHAPAGIQSQPWLNAHPKPQGLVAGLIGGLDASNSIQALPDHPHQGFTATPKGFAVPGPMGAINPGCALPVISGF